MSNEALDEVLNQLRDHGIEPFTKRSPGWVFGKLVRCKVEGDRSGRLLAGTYCTNTPLPAARPSISGASATGGRISTRNSSSRVFA